MNIHEGSHPRAGVGTALLALALIATLAALVPGPASGVPTDTLSVVKADQQGVSNALITALISEVTPPVGDAVMITRDDNFADALASGLLQRSGPLFAVPTGGPIPEPIRARIRDLQASRAVVLGGPAAIGEEVVAELASLGLTTSRLAGESRFGTAIEIARAEAPQADTAMLARAFPATGSTDPTQAFADTLAAGGLSARRSWPVLLTSSSSLTEQTADYLRSSQIRRVLVLGGTAAISEAVFAEVSAIVPNVERVAGATRFDTAVALEKVDGAQDASGATQVILVEGTGSNAFGRTGPRQGGGAAGPAPWAAGYASANRAFIYDAPILLTASGRIPEPTATFLAPGVGGDPATAPLITCTMTGPACELGRQAAGLPPAATVTVTPGEGTLSPGASISVSITGATGEVSAGGSCLGYTTTFDAAMGASLATADPLPAGGCTLVIDGITLSDGTQQRETFTYTVGAAVTLTGLSSVCGLATDGAVLYAVECNVTAAVHRFGLDGQPLSPPTIPLPKVTNDVDVDVIDGPATIFGTSVPAGSLLVVDGEVEAGAMVLDPTTGAVLAGPVDLEETGTTVGVAWDSDSNQIVELSWDTDMISRLAADTGASASTSGTGPDPDDPGSDGSFDVFFGDIDTTCTGHLMIISSNEEEVQELSPGGDFIGTYEVPTVASGKAALALDKTTGTAYIGRNGSPDVEVITTLPVGRC